jgi:hypothetical protein
MIIATYQLLRTSKYEQRSNTTYHHSCKPVKESKAIRQLNTIDIYNYHYYFMRIDAGHYWLHDGLQIQG